MKEYSDHDIVILYRDANTRNKAIEIIVSNFSERIYWLVRRMVIHHDDANDVVQNTFIKVWQNLESFRQESSLFSWIYRIAVNESLNFLKRKRTILFIPLYDIENNLCQGLTEPAAFDADDCEQKLQLALLKLPDKQRLVFNMKYFERMSYEEISEVLGTSVGALKASFHLAIKKIEKILSS